jgi:CheY-like chemotaxis protein
MQTTDDSPMTVGGIMSADPLLLAATLGPDQALEEMARFDREYAYVVDSEGHYLGTLAVLDLLKRSGQRHQNHPNLQTLTMKEAPTLEPGQALSVAVRILQMTQGPVAAVLHRGRVIGELQLKQAVHQLMGWLQAQETYFQELHSQHRKRDEYLSLAAHDLRAPLTVVHLSADYLLSNDASKALSQEQISFVERIKRNCDLCSSMVNEMLDVVRLEKPIRLNTETIEIWKLLQDVEAGLKALAMSRNQILKIRLEQDVKAKIDVQRFSQILENLVLHGCESSPDAVEMTLRFQLQEESESPRLAVNFLVPGSQVVGGVEEKLYESLAKESDKQERRRRRSIHLAVAKKFVEFHNGTFTLEGGWPHNLEITCLLPQASLVKEGLQARMKAKPISLLLVEDDRSIREFYRLSLEAADFEIVEAGDGREALLALEQFRPDIIVADIRMPHMDGIELLARVRASGKSMPVILCSGFYLGLEQDLQRSRYRPDRIIDKPFKVKDLIEAIQEQLRLQQKAS